MAISWACALAASTVPSSSTIDRAVSGGREAASRLTPARRIRDVVAGPGPDAIVCIDTFHVVSWATDVLEEVRRDE